MKWFLILATVIGGLTILGSTARAGGHRLRSTPYGYRDCPRYSHPGAVAVGTPGVIYLGPPVRVAPVYTYPPPVVYGPGYAYPGFYGW